MNNPNQWPPAPYDIAIKDMETWKAWYAGNTDELTRIYAHQGHTKIILPNGAHGKTTGETYFWGRPNPQARKRRHLPVPADISRASADLLFANPPYVRLGENDQPAKPDKDPTTGNEIPLDTDTQNRNQQRKKLGARLATIFDPADFPALLNEAAQWASVLGGTYLTAWWDRELRSHVVPTHVTADRAIPTFRFGILSSVTFWNELQPDPTNTTYTTSTLRHLEHHTPGKITHELWAGTSNTLGEQIPLDHHPDTAWVLQEDETGIIETGLKRLDVVYIPNKKPNKAWIGINQLAPLGCSDYDGIESEFDAIDENASGLIRDVRDGASKIFVDEMLLRDDGIGKGATFDQDQGAYVKLAPGMGSAKDGSRPIESVQLSIRWQEYSQVQAEILTTILQNVGISAQNFNDGRLSTQVTATEVNANSATSENTRKAKINFWRKGITEFVEMCMELDSVQFNTGLNLTDRPNVRFPAQATQSDSEKATTIRTKKEGGFLSTETAVRQDHPDWTDDEVMAELDRIAEDKLRETRLSFGKGLDDSGEATPPTYDEGDPQPREVGDDWENLADDLDSINNENQK